MDGSPDTIVPDPGNPQALNRYSYVLNNPVKYVDSSGHFAFVPLLIAGGVGLVAAGGIDLAKQLVVDQKSWDQVDWAEVGGSAVGGLVAGATLGLAPAGAGVVTLAMLGGVGGAAGSQAQALSQAGIEEFLGTNPQGSVIREAMELGLFDPGMIVINAAVGGFTGGLSSKLSSLLRTRLSLPESSTHLSFKGQMPMVRWQHILDQEGKWMIQLEGRVLTMSAETWERLVRGASILGYEAFVGLLEEAIEQGLVTSAEETLGP